MDNLWRTYLDKIGTNYWDAGIPDWVDGLPSMMHRREKAMLYYLARDFPGEIEKIIDAGCYVGASTVAFSRGLLDRAQKPNSNSVVSYDLFLADRISSEILNSFKINVPPGHSFFGIFLDFVNIYIDIVSIVKGNIMDFGWNGGAISMLFLDILKSPPLNDHCCRTFFPHLTGGRSIVLHQDYIHDPLPWIPLTMAALDRYFELVGHCKNTAIFLCREAPSPDAVEQALQIVNGSDLEAKDALFTKILAPFPDGVANINLRLSRIWMLAGSGASELARQELERIDVTEAWVATKVNRLRAALSRP